MMTRLSSRNAVRSLSDTSEALDGRLDSTAREHDFCGSESDQAVRNPLKCKGKSEPLPLFTRGILILYFLPGVDGT